MKLCKVEKLAAGDTLAKSIITDDYQILLSRETRLSNEYIEKLKNLGITEVYIYEEEYKEEAAVILKQDVEKVYRDKVKDILEKHTYSKNEELRILSQTADSIIVNILEEKEVIERIYDIKERSSDLYEHSINTCILATLVSLKLQLPKETVHDIGVACLLHDLGHRYMIYSFSGKEEIFFTATELAEYRKHPIYGYSAVKDEPWISPLSKNIILYHHEKMDGSGYPLKLKHIPFEARIVAVCDSFDEMICGIYCKRVKVHEAIEFLKIFKGTKFDDKIVNTLFEFTAVYPVGSIILTNDDETGIVIRQNKVFSDRPVIQIIKDRNGNIPEIMKEIDLMKDNTVFIEKVLD